MGAVHGVALKYVAIGCALGAAAARQRLANHRVSAAVLGAAALQNGLISVLFCLRTGSSLIGKRAEDGSVPAWCTGAISSVRKLR